jgi:hypothetical protein
MKECDNSKIHISSNFKLSICLLIMFHTLLRPSLHCNTSLHFWIFSPSSIWRCGPTRAMASSFLKCLDHKQRHTTVSRTPLYKWSPRRRDLYLTTHNTHNRQTSIPPVRFEPTIPAGERPQTHTLDRAATGTGNLWCSVEAFVIN